MKADKIVVPRKAGPPRDPQSRLVELSRDPTNENLMEMIGFFSDRNWNLRSLAARTLAAVGEKCVPVISQKLFLDREVDEDTLYWSIHTLGMLGVAGLKALLPLLENPLIPPHYRGFIVKALGGIDHPDAVRALIRCLSEPSYTVREDAATTLMGVGAAMIPAVKNAFTTGNDDTRYWCVKILGKVLASEAIPYFKKMLTAKKRELRYYAVAALGEIDDDRAIAAVAEAFLDESWLVRAQASEVLEKWGMRSIKFLTEIFSRGDADARFRTLKFMGKIMGHEAVSFITKILNTGEAEMKFYALSALGETGDTTIIPLLINAFRDRVWLVRKHASAVLERFGARAVGPLVGAMTGSERDDNVRHWGLVSLVAIGPPAFDALTLIYSESTKRERIMILEGITASGDPRAMRLALAALADPDWPVRNTAANLLSGHARKVLPDLIEALRGGNSDVKFWVSKIMHEAAADLVPTFVHELSAGRKVQGELEGLRERAIMVLCTIGTRDAMKPLVDLARSDPLGGEKIRETLKTFEWQGKRLGALLDLWNTEGETADDLFFQYISAARPYSVADFLSALRHAPDLRRGKMLEIMSGWSTHEVFFAIAQELPTMDRRLQPRLVGMLLDNYGFEGLDASLRFLDDADPSSRATLLQELPPVRDDEPFKVMLERHPTVEQGYREVLEELIVSVGKKRRKQVALIASKVSDPTLRDLLTRALEED